MRIKSFVLGAVLALSSISLAFGETPSPTNPSGGGINPNPQPLFIFTPKALINPPIPNGLEYDGTNLWFTNPSGVRGSLANGAFPSTINTTVTWGSNGILDFSTGSIINFADGSVWKSTGLIFGSGTSVSFPDGSTWTGTGLTFSPTNNVRSLVNVKSFGATGNGSTDDTTAIQNAINAVQGTGKILYFPPGQYLVSSTLIITSPINIRGEFPTFPAPLATPSGGSWIFFDSNNTGIFVNTGSTSSSPSGTDIGNLGFYRSTQVVPGSGTYTPTVQGEDIEITANDYTSIHDCLFLNPYIGIVSNGSGGLNLRNLYLGAINQGIAVSFAADTVYVNNIHIWPFWTWGTEAGLTQYTLANLGAYVFGNVANPMITNIFSEFANRGLYFFSYTPSGGSAGTTVKLHLVNADMDAFGKYGIFFGAAGFTGQFDNITMQSSEPTDTNTGSTGIYDDAGGITAQFNNLSITNVESNAIGQVASPAGGNSYISVNNLYINNYGLSGTTVPALTFVAGLLSVGPTSTITNGGGGPVLSGNVAISSPYFPQNVTSSRATNTTYTNNYGHTITVTITGYNSTSSQMNATATVNGIGIENLTLPVNDYGYFEFKVPAGGTYSTNIPTISEWTEG